MGVIVLFFRAPTVLLGISLSIAGTLLATKAHVLWFFLVLGTLSTCGWLQPKIPSRFLVLYFVVSVLGGLLFLLSCGNFYFSTLILQLSLLLKLGLAPFQFWVYSVIQSLGVSETCLFLGPFKFGLLYLLVCVGSVSFLLCSLSFFIGLTLLWITSRLQLVLFASGALQLLVFVVMGHCHFATYYFIYLLALLGVACSSTGLVSPLLAFFGLAAVPPLTLFWGKLLAIVTLPVYYGLMVILLSLLRIWPYIRCSIEICLSRRSSFCLVLLLSGVPFCIVSFSFCFCDQASLPHCYSLALSSSYCGIGSLHRFYSSFLVDVLPCISALSLGLPFTFFVR